DCFPLTAPTATIYDVREALRVQRPGRCTAGGRARREVEGEMNAATLMTLTAGALDVVLGSLALAFASAEGWRHFRVFAAVAFSAAAYSLGNAVFASADPPEQLVLLAGRANMALACTHCAAWLIYVRRQYQSPIR